MVSRVAVVGAGRLGAPMAVCLAAKGFQVTVVDTDRQRAQRLCAGEVPVFEPGVDELLPACADRLRAMDDAAAAVTDSDVTFVVVPTPSESDGAFSLRFVLTACDAIGAGLRQRSAFHVVAIVSTVMPGATGGAIRSALEARSGKRCGVDFGLCYNPQFIALGTFVRDFLHRDFTLIGESDERSGDLLASVYRCVAERDHPIARMSFVNAEIAKLAVNTFITTKISFANMLARLCERLPGADVDVVTAALGHDARIGPKYLKGAISYGGPCFPRDNLAMAAVARAVDGNATLAAATDQFNRYQIGWLGDLVLSHLPANGSVAILGLSYKPGTDVLDESPGVLLAGWLAERHVPVVVQDPAAATAVNGSHGETLARADTPEECIARADVVVLTTPWNEYRALRAEHFARNGSPRTVIDCWRLLDGELADAPVTYIPLGIGRTCR